MCNIVEKKIRNECGVWQFFWKLACRDNDKRRDFCPSVILQRLDWYLVTDVSGQPIVPIFKGIVFNIHGSVHRSMTAEITNKMLPYIRIYYSTVH